MQIKRGPVPMMVGAMHSYMEHLSRGALATDGIAYSGVVTVGTSGVDVFDQLIQPGVNMSIFESEFGLTAKFTELTGSVGTVNYYWQSRTEYNDPEGSLRTGAYCNLTGTYSKGVAASSTSEDTFSGYVPIASLSQVPFRLKLTAVASGDARVTGRVKNSSYIYMAGIVIPGT